MRSSKKENPYIKREARHKAVNGTTPEGDDNNGLFLFPVGLDEREESCMRTYAYTCV